MMMKIISMVVIINISAAILYQQRNEKETPLGIKVNIACYGVVRGGGAFFTNPRSPDRGWVAPR